MIAFGVEERQNYSLLKVIGCAGAVLIHICAKVINNYQTSSPESLALAVGLSALVRWVVPAFVMVSGAVFLGREYKWTKKRIFYKKRLLRVFVPFIFWNLLYFIVFVGGDIREGLFDWWKYSQTYYHLYYLAIALGLYLVTPILRKINPKLLTFVGLTLATGYIGGYYLGWWPKFDYLPLIFIPYLGLYGLGGLLEKRRLPIIWLGLVGLAALAMAVTTFRGVNRLGATDGGQMVFDRLWPWIAVQAAIAMLTLKNRLNKLAIIFEPLTLGIYLIHPIFTDFVFFQESHFVNVVYAIWWIITRWIGAIVLSGTVTLMIKKIHFFKLVVGG